MAQILLDDFFPGESVGFSITISKNSVVQNITNDTVTVRVKKRKTDTDASSLISKNADVATSGAIGIATFSLLPSETNIATGDYYLDVEWTLATGGIYVAHNQVIRVKDRVSDV